MSLPSGWSRFLVLVVLAAFPVAVYAQEAVIIGTVSDQTGGVLPGVTITA